MAGGPPLGVDILSQRLVLWRDPATGAVAALDDACPHRGAPLSAGWVESGAAGCHVVCGYHGEAARR